MRSENRTPVILGVIAGVLAVAVGVTLTVALTRTPADAESADSTPTAPVATTPTTPESPSPSESPVPIPVALAMAGSGFSLVDDAGSPTFTFAWRDDVAPAVAALSEAFGTAPTTRVEPGDGNHYPDYTVYQWNGFSLFDMIAAPGGKTRDEYSQPSYLLYTKNEIGDIEIRSEFGLSIGMSATAVRAVPPDAEWPRGNVGNIRFVFGKDRSGVTDGTPTYSVFADSDGTVVTTILAYMYSDL